MERTQFGKYTVVAKVGQGAMGDVYKAHDAVLNRHVALKTIASSLESSPDARLRFHREAQSIARLNHPNIVTVYDFGEEEGEVYMAMEFLEGSDLRTLIASKRLSALDDKLALVEEVCEGVGYAHSMSVVHRDLKPANIHVLKSGRVKVMDFGLARIGATSGMTQTGTVLGTPHYMSPEQVKGQKADSRSDVFALGAILYEMLTGHQPFEAESMHAVLFRILESEPEPVRRWYPTVPAAVAALVEKALAKGPEQRFADGTAMSAAVRAARAELSGEATKGQGSLATLLAAEDGEDATRAIPTSAPATRGNLALEALVASDPHASPPAETHQGIPTLSGKAPTRPGATPARRPGAAPAEGAGGGQRWVIVAAAAVVAVAGGLIAWGVLRAPGPRPASAPVPAAEVRASELQQQLLEAERTLAQETLQDREYTKAIDHAERALGVSPDDAEALRVRDAARQALDSAQGLATAAREALEAGDTTTAARRLGELLEVQPGHAAVAGLTAELNDRFRPQAEQARAAMRQSESETRAAGASDQALARAGGLSREGAGAFSRGEYAAAAERFLSARDAFARAGREAAAAARQAEATRQADEQRAAEEREAEANRQAEERKRAEAQRQAEAERAAQARQAAAERRVAAAPPPPPVTAPAAKPVAPAPPTGPSDETLIRELVADYGRAIATRDIGLFRRVKPNLSGGEEERLRQAFQVDATHDVNIEILELEVGGSTARVHLARRDVIGGKSLDPFEQVLSLRRGPQGWTVDSIGR